MLQRPLLQSPLAAQGWPKRQGLARQGAPQAPATQAPLRQSLARRQRRPAGQARQIAPPAIHVGLRGVAQMLREDCDEEARDCTLVGLAGSAGLSGAPEGERAKELLRTGCDGGDAHACRLMEAQPPSAAGATGGTQRLER